MKILLLGGSGYIGMNLALTLLQSEHEVTVFDIKKCSAELNNYIYSKNYKFNFHHVDLTRNTEEWKLIDTDAVVILAALKNVSEGEVKPYEYIGKNTLITTNSIQYCVECIKCPKIIICSSSSVYHVDDITHCAEELVPLALHGNVKIPKGIYGYSKRMSEDISAILISKQNVSEIVILRICNPIGTHDMFPIWSDIGLFSLLLKKPNIFTNMGNCIRDYIHIMDLCTLFENIMKNWNDVIENSKQEGYYDHGSIVLNAGVGEGYSVSDIISLIELLCSDCVPHFVVDAERRDFEPQKVIADMTRLLRVVPSWKPEKDIYHGIVQTFGGKIRSLSVL